MSIEHHVKRKQIALATAISGRKKVYLDLRFWIWLRDAAAGAPKTAAVSALLDYLRFAVARGAIVCPISDVAFIELMKQVYSDDRRIATARLVDELSLGVSLLNSRTRIATEINSFFMTHWLGHDLLHPMQELVWTKLCHVLGESYPYLPGMEADAQLRLQQAFIDHLWETTLTEMITTIGDKAPQRDAFAALSEETNRQRDLHQADITSYTRAYEIEIRGAIDVCGDVISEVLSAWAERNGVTPAEEGSDAWREAQVMGKNLLFHAFKKPETRRAIRSLHIEASLHAALRVDKPRRFMPNDFYDFHHASAAIGYCDAFFTENPLRELSGQKTLALSQISECIVLSEPEAALSLLRRIAPL